MTRVAADDQTVNGSGMSLRSQCEPPLGRWSPPSASRFSHPSRPRPATRRLSRIPTGRAIIARRRRRRSRARGCSRPTRRRRCGARAPPRSSTSCRRRRAPRICPPTSSGGTSRGSTSPAACGSPTPAMANSRPSCSTISAAGSTRPWPAAAPARVLLPQGLLDVVERRQARACARLHECRLVSGGLGRLGRGRPAAREANAGAAAVMSGPLLRRTCGSRQFSCRQSIGNRGMQSNESGSALASGATAEGYKPMPLAVMLAY